MNQQLNEYFFVVRPAANIQKKYIVRRAKNNVDISAGWDSDCWDFIAPARLETELYRSHESSGHLPDTQIKMQYDDAFLYGLFRVKDRYVKALAQNDQEQVCHDSCVEFFVKPAESSRYFNFEMNCGGTLLTYCIEDLQTRLFDTLSMEDLASVERFHTLPKRIVTEITSPVTWRLGFKIPFALFTKYVGTAPPHSGDIWTANFTKCADRTSHPHWLSWQPSSGFHCPDEFGDLVFE